MIKDGLDTLAREMARTVGLLQNPCVISSPRVALWWEIDYLFVLKAVAVEETVHGRKQSG